jgi:hypothetical protein
MIPTYAWNALPLLVIPALVVITIQSGTQTTLLHAAVLNTTPIHQYPIYAAMNPVLAVPRALKTPA